MEHVQTIFTQICKEDCERRKMSVKTVRTDNGDESFFNGKSIGVNLTYNDITAFYAGQDCFYRMAIDEIINYRNWLEGIRLYRYADEYIAECRKGIGSYKQRKMA